MRPTHARRLHCEVPGCCDVPAPTCVCGSIATLQACGWFKLTPESSRPRIYPIAGAYLCDDHAQDYGAPAYRRTDDWSIVWSK